MTVFSGQPFEYVYDMLRRTKAPCVIYEEFPIVRTFMEDNKFKFMFLPGGLLRAVTDSTSSASKYVTKLNQEFYGVSKFAYANEMVDEKYLPKPSGEVMTVPRLQKTLVKRDTVSLLFGDPAKGIDIAIKKPCRIFIPHIFGIVVQIYDFTEN